MINNLKPREFDTTGWRVTVLPPALGTYTFEARSGCERCGERTLGTMYGNGERDYFSCSKCGVPTDRTADENEIMGIGPEEEDIY